jgi:nucleotide-binding universal stress UspA family protein
MRTILLATDGSESAGDALELAIELARETGAAVEVVTVQLPIPRGRGGGGMPMTSLETRDGALQIANDAATRLVGEGVQARPQVAYGDPASEIARLAKELDADLAVVGSRGFGPVRGTVFGSVSRALVSHCPVPVTVVRAHARDRVATA